MEMGMGDCANAVRLFWLKGVRLEFDLNGIVSPAGIIRNGDGLILGSLGDEKPVERILHAYVLMGIHFHLALETPEPNLSVGMRGNWPGNYDLGAV